VIRAANEFINRLPDHDLVGVVTLPHGLALRPTTDRIALRDALGKMSGWQGMRTNRYNLTTSEVMEITAEDGQIEMPAPGRGGAAAATGLGLNTALRSVQLRECRGTTDMSCLQGILMEAESLERLYEEQVTESLVGLNGLLGQLAELPGRKTVVLLSAGMPVSDRPGSWHSDGGEARMLGRAAALANATVYSIHLDQGYRTAYSAESRTARPTFSAARERELGQMMLNEFAVSSGGALLSVSTGSGEFALDRLLFETSAYYLLGVAPDQLDLDGKTHELRVRVDRRGVNIRARRFVVLRPGS
jgi:VWFA-related protein